MENKYFLKKNWDLIIVLILYSLLTVLYLHYYQYKTGGDELSYINIAHEYAVGKWGDAINGYWSPLYSWLMTPFLLLGSTPLYAVYVSKIVSIIIGFFTIISVNRLSRTFGLSKVVKRALLFSLVPVILYFSLMYNTPDLLLVCVLVYYLAIIFDPEYSDKWFNGVLCGFLGALAYLTKSFAFPFFLAHFILFNLIYYFKGLNSQKRRNVLKNMVLGLFVFFVIGGLWAGTISEKYGKLTISTSGEHNQALVGPVYAVNPIEHAAHPIYYMGLLKPPYNSSISIWDDPSTINMVKWSPFDSVGSFEYELKLIWANILYTTQIIESFFLIAVVIIVAAVLFILKSKSQKASKDKLIYLLITMFIYVGGYCLIVPEWRYYFLIFILLMLMGFYLIDTLYKNKNLNSTLRNILLIVLILSFVMEPIYELNLFATSEDNVYILSNNLKDDYGIHGNLASNNEWDKDIASEKWGEMLCIAYYSNCKYYGLTKKNENSKDLQGELDANNIDYYFVWDDHDNITLPGYMEITNDEIQGLKIYKRNGEN
ncbi:ArnT family glycosyltransferase [Methanobacterium paludis]|uniref:Glycosyltransferase RgtA/B/C/D-like domain-containing protein n=1 Tax=Methanobacterium paludis (strain DSM 25820 / JCM 18151 / SWAN1) TaxID=868131 RepID=F6D808_METPW|nr:glycosyltransferase family 39 protein [Methanobacterium paludis]AEG18531.1 hypothetical protein MSWAN_1517 [Methanobacterium paludis]